MVIKLFVYILVAFSTIAYFIPVSNENNKSEDKDIALVTFFDSTMYTLNEDTTTRIVNSSKVVRYKTKDVMYDAEFTLKPKNNLNAVDKIYSDIIIKRKDDFTFLDNVKYTRDNDINLNTQELYYNSTSKIAKNSVSYYGNYYKHDIKGTNLYFDLNKNYLKSKDVHFEIDTQKQ